MRESSETMRVAAAQFAAGTDIESNLEKCLWAIDQAGAQGAELLVLPEFCNHLSWYDDPAHCSRVSLEKDGPFLKAVAERARAAGAFVVINCTLRRAGGAVTGTSLLFSPQGECIAETDKQVLMGHEGDFLRAGETPCPIVQASAARVAMYACMDGVIPETPRCLALRGAQLLCNSLNSFAFDEASLHVPVRAAENRVFVAAANKVGPLVPAEFLEAVSEATHIPAALLHGAGESQIVAPSGEVLARASRQSEEVILAEITPAQADDKLRPDGTNRFAARRPELYAPIVQGAAGAHRQTGAGARELRVALVEPEGEGEAAVKDACARGAREMKAGAGLVVLPELFCFADGRVAEPAAAAEFSRRAARELAAACTGAQGFIVTSLVLREGERFFHSAVLIDGSGLRAEQKQMHRCARHDWSDLGDEVRCADLPFARLAMLTGDDALYPEHFRLLALSGAEVAAAAMHLMESWEAQTGLVERAAENRVNLAVSTRSSAAGRGLLASLQEEFTLLTDWKARRFEGEISRPEITRVAEGERTARAVLYPRAAANKLLSGRTDVLDSRPRKAAGAILETHTGGM